MQHQSPDVPKTSQTDAGIDASELPSVNVVARCRPLNDAEKVAGSGIAVSCCSPLQVVVRNSDIEHPYSVDCAFDADATQSHIFERLGEPLVGKAFVGFNAAMFAYGAMGTGKTHTMLGGASKSADEGLVPRIGRSIFKRIQAQLQAHDTRRFLVQCSFCEICNEVVHDLLAPSRGQMNTAGKSTPSKEHGTSLQHLTKTVVSDEGSFGSLLDVGVANRAAVASTFSHYVFMIGLFEEDADGARKPLSKMSFVGLAALERVSINDSEGVKVKAEAHVNKTFSALSNLINALNSMPSRGGRSQAHMPYRDSKLTKIVQESLEGNTICTLMLTVSSAASAVDETLATMNYGKRAKMRPSTSRSESSPLRLPRPSTASRYESPMPVRNLFGHQTVKVGTHAELEEARRKIEELEKRASAADLAASDYKSKNMQLEASLSQLQTQLVAQAGARAWAEDQTRHARKLLKAEEEAHDLALSQLKKLKAEAAGLTAKNRQLAGDKAKWFRKFEQYERRRENLAKRLNEAEKLQQIVNEGIVEKIEKQHGGSMNASDIDSDDDTTLRSYLDSPADPTVLPYATQDRFYTAGSDDPSTVVSDAAPEGGIGGSANRVRVGMDEVILPEGWAAYDDGIGNTYYGCDATGESSWTLPIGSISGDADDSTSECEVVLRSLPTPCGI